MGRATLGAFRSTPLGIITAESGLTPARALLDHRQAGFAQRLYARPRDGDGPEEILERERPTLSTRLKAAAVLRRGGTAEGQEWGQRRRFPGQIVVDTRVGALDTARTWTKGRYTFWTDGSRLDSGKVGAACVWGHPEEWSGQRFHLGTNKEVFDAEVYTIYQALHIAAQRQESGRRYSIFADSTAAISRIQSDNIGPGQAFTVAAIKVTHILSRNTLS